jgi:hypothetical protein
MIGNNVLTINEATMMAAIQMYLDSQRNPDAGAVIVESVKALANGRYSDCFEVALSTVEK